jgi:hypothetical protein
VVVMMVVVMVKGGGQLTEKWIEPGVFKHAEEKAHENANTSDAGEEEESSLTTFITPRSRLYVD